MTINTNSNDENMYSINFKYNTQTTKITKYKKQKIIKIYKYNKQRKTCIKSFQMTTNSNSNDEKMY